MRGAFDPRNLRPQEIVQLLNSTDLGPVIVPRQLHRHRENAGFRIGDGKKVDFFRYAGWLFDRRHSPDRPAEGYEAHRDRMGADQRDKAKSVREIGTIPACRLTRVRARAKFDLAFFLKAFFPDQFPLDWSEDHLAAIATLQHAILHGGLFSLGMPRGSGKTTIAEGAALWALLYGHRKFVSIVGPDEKHALDCLNFIKRHIEDNDRLMRAFPEVCYPISRLEGIPQRRLLYQGQRILLRWEGDKLMFPNIPGAESAGAIIGTCSLTGQIRGQKLEVVVQDGAGRRRVYSRRPDFVIVDDPQTRESAKNPETSRERAKLIEGDVLGLSGPDTPIAAVMPCTVIYPGDLSDIFLDREKKPAWQGVRTKMLISFPTNMKLWKEYDEARREGQKAGDRGEAGDAFYREHQAALDKGAKVSWEQRLEGRISAIQNAMDKFLEKPESFFAEYQNDPRADNQGEEQLAAELICSKLSGSPRGEAPLEINTVTSFIDLHKEAFYWIVVGWDQHFGGAVLDYGTFPDQERSFFFLSDLPRPLSQEPGFAGASLEEILFGGLQNLTSQLLVRDWVRADGSPLRIDRCLIDANWGLSRDTVYRFCRQSAFTNILTPSHGAYAGVKSTPFAARGKKDRDRVGTNWRQPAVERRGEVRHVTFCTNSWKSFVKSRLLTSEGAKGSLSLFGDDPSSHSLIGLHWTAERFKNEEYAGRRMEEWKKPRPNQPDNHWWDGIVGCAVGASMQGVNVHAAPPANPRPASQPARVNLTAAPGHGSFFVSDR